MANESRSKEADSLREYIAKRIELALRGRSWNWLAQKAGVSQSTLTTNKNETGFSLDTLLKVCRALGKPIRYFLPDQGWEEKDTVAEEAFYRVASIVDWARRTTPDDLEKARDLGGGVVPHLPNEPLVLRAPEPDSPSGGSSASGRGKKGNSTLPP